jgi:hypothetical protein
VYRGLDDVLQGGHVREEVEALEDHPDLGPAARHLRLAELVELVARFAVSHQLAVDPQPSCVDLLEVVDAAQEGRLAGARRAQQAHDLARSHLERDALQHLEAAEALVHLLGAQHRVGHRPSPEASGAATRA